MSVHFKVCEQVTRFRLTALGRFDKTGDPVDSPLSHSDSASDFLALRGPRFLGRWNHFTFSMFDSIRRRRQPASPLPASRDAVDRAANQQIRKNRKHEHGDQRFSQVKPA